MSFARRKLLWNIRHDVAELLWKKAREHNLSIEEVCFILTSHLAEVVDTELKAQEDKYDAEDDGKSWYSEKVQKERAATYCVSGNEIADVPYLGRRCIKCGIPEEDVK